MTGELLLSIPDTSFYEIEFRQTIESRAKPISERDFPWLLRFNSLSGGLGLPDSFSLLDTCLQIDYSFLFNTVFLYTL